MTQKPGIFFKQDPAIDYGVEVHPLERAAYWLAALFVCLVVWRYWWGPALVSLYKTIMGAF